MDVLKSASAPLAEQCREALRVSKVLRLRVEGLRIRVVVFGVSALGGRGSNRNQEHSLTDVPSLHKQINSNYGMPKGSHPSYGNRCHHHDNLHHTGRGKLRGPGSPPGS